jgi:hypothetical protein
MINSPASIDMTDRSAATLAPISRRSGSKKRKDEDEWQGGNIGYVKGKEEVPLEARIERLFYINLYGQVCLHPPMQLFRQCMAGIKSADRRCNGVV